jgi:tyrosyl-tRNA synthetase
VGHLLPLLMLRRFQNSSHKPIAVVGGATGMIGDPSGKSQERNLLSEEDLRRNVAAIHQQMRRFLDFDAGRYSAELVNNYDWIGPFSYLEFLRDVGKNFPVNVMLAKDSVKSRLSRDDSGGDAGGLSYTEFSYMLLQAYDFVYLYDKYGCELQIGGSDQWGNITAGIDLARRMRSVQLYGLTCPLLTKSDGSKMGKTESGTVWLSPERTSPYQFYQYWIRVEDADVGKCLRMLTTLPRKEIESLDAVRAEDASKRESQRKLAEELTRLVHGDVGLAAAQRATEIFYGAEITDLNDAQLAEIFADVPSQTVSHDLLTAGGGLPVIDALVAAGLAKSKGDARRITQQGGAYVNNRRVESADTRLTAADLASQSVMVLRAGKKNYALLRFE